MDSFQVKIQTFRFKLEALDFDIYQKNSLKVISKSPMYAKGTDTKTATKGTDDTILKKLETQ